MPRNLTPFADIATVPVEQVNTLASDVAGVAANIAVASQEAKIAENFTQAQLEIQQLDNDFRIKNQADPLNKTAFDEYKGQRKLVYDKYAEGISTLFLGDWRQNTNKLDFASEQANQAWAVGQAKKNTIASVQKSLDNSLFMAQQNGQAFGRGEKGDLESLLNYAPTRDTLRNTLVNSIGEMEAEEVLTAYDEDYMKSFIAGVADTNPVAALGLLDNPMAKKALATSPKYFEFKEALENRALNFQEVAIKRETLDAVKQSYGLFTSGKALTVAEVQQVADKMSPAARDYFLRANGMKRMVDGTGGGAGAEAKPVKLSAEEKIIEEANLYEEVTNTLEKEEYTAEDAQRLEGIVFTALNNKIITKNTANQLIATVLEPLNNNLEKALDDYEPSFFSSNKGFGVIQDFYKDYSKKFNKAADKILDNEDNKSKKESVKATFAAMQQQDKARLYSTFYNGLAQVAAKKQVDMVALRDLPEYENIVSAVADATKIQFKISKLPNAITTRVPLKDIEKLIKNPETREQFDTQYGAGTADRILNSK